MIDKPLFVPLRREHFEAFASGRKRVETRRYSARWNERSCRIGRPVVLSLGYAGARLSGRVVSFERATRDSDIYGQGADCALIGIEIMERNAT